MAALCGRTGCGKTSLINSLKFAAHGKLRRSQWQPAAGQEKAGGHTMFRKATGITEKIFVVDNRGLDDPNTEQAIAELRAQLEGKRGYGDIVPWQATYPRNDDLDPHQINSITGHRIDYCILVFNARHDIEMNTHGLTELIKLIRSNQGHRPTAVITHVDVTFAKAVKTLKAVLQGSGVRDIFEVANLTDGHDKLEDFYQLSLLLLLKECLINGDEIFKHYQLKIDQVCSQLMKEQDKVRRKTQRENEIMFSEEKLRREIKLQRKNMTILAKELTKKETEIDALEKKMQESDKEVASLKEDMKNKEEQIKLLNNKVRRKNMQIVVLQKEIKRRDTQMAP